MSELKKFQICYSMPMCVDVIARNEDEAREIFLQGETSGDYSDPDGQIGEPNQIITMSDAMVKDLYDNGECPDCQETIPDDAELGQNCVNCEHVWTWDVGEFMDFENE